MRANLPIKAYIHCATCGPADDHLEVGMHSPSIMVVHCATCDQDVGTFGLHEPMKLHCDVCGEDIGPDHKH